MRGSYGPWQEPSNRHAIHRVGRESEQPIEFKTLRRVSGNPAAPAGMSGDDLIAWKTQLATALPEGRGAIARDAANPAIVTVTVEWVDRDDNRAADAQVLQFQTTTRL